MYRCKDCGTEYNKKVDYCDCGNNTFEYIEDMPVSKPHKNPLTIEQKGEIISRFFLFLCLILSVIVWIIPVKTEPVKITEKVEIKPVTNIPSIDNFWDNTPKKVEEKKEVVINEEPIPLSVIPDYAKPKSMKKAETKQPPKTETKKSTSQQKKVSQPKTVTQTKTVVQPKAGQQTKTVTQTNVRTATPIKQKTTVQPSAQKTSVSQPIQHKQQPVQTKPAVTKTNDQPLYSTYNPNSPEMLKYKGSLRAALFSKFPVGSIQGSGECSVHFSIDSNGKLINRGFTKQSDNKSLNDAVYYMLMSVPKFTPPPDEYNGSTIKMIFKINNGSYEISIY